MNNRIIDVVQYFNYLGIMLDADMSWKTHVAMVRNKLSRINGILHRLKYIYPQNDLITLYKSLFVPHINYGSLLWGHAGGTLDKIKKKAVRTITYSRRAKLGQIQGGLQRALQDSTKGGCNNFFTFYPLKIELFRVFTLSD